MAGAERGGRTDTGAAGATQSAYSAAGSPTRLAADQALERALERLHQEQGLVETPTLSEFVGMYLAQHDTEPETITKLRWLLSKAIARFGEFPISELLPAEIAAWRMTIPYGHRFEATQEQIRALAERIGARYRSLVLFAAATGLRPSEWIALEHRDIDREARIAYVRRAYRNGRLKCPKTDGSLPAVPLQQIALEALDRLPASNGSPLPFPAPCGGYLDLHNFRHRDWKPAQRTLGIDPVRRVYDLRHTTATFALRAGISTFDLSRYMGASLTMIDRHYGHLAQDGRQHAINLLDAYGGNDVHAVDARWTFKKGSPVNSRAENRP